MAIHVDIILCPICESGCEEFKNGSLIYYRCDKCGKFIINSDFMYEDKNEELYSAMYFYISQHTKRGKYQREKFYYFCHEKPTEEIMAKLNESYITCFNQPNGLGGQCEAITNDFLLANIYPTDFNDRVDKSVLNFCKLAGDIDGSICQEVVGCTILSRAFFIYSAENKYSKNREFTTRKIESFIKLLIEMGYIAWQEHLKGYSLTAKGWQRINELQRKLKVLPQAFVAMWFDKNGSMNNAKQAIREVIENDCHYKCVIMDDEQHNKQIVPEIFYQIKKSQFVIADITGHRNGVYYEAGYAEALGKEVIVTCQEDNFKDVHFDIAQKKAILWETEEDLKKQLFDRIESTVGLNKNM